MKSLTDRLLLANTLYLKKKKIDIYFFFFIPEKTVQQMAHRINSKNGDKSKNDLRF